MLSAPHSLRQVPPGQSALAAQGRPGLLPPLQLDLKVQSSLSLAPPKHLAPVKVNAAMVSNVQFTAQPSAPAGWQVPPPVPDVSAVQRVPSLEPSRQPPPSSHSSSPSTMPLPHNAIPGVGLGGGGQPSGGNRRIFWFARPSSLARRQPSSLKSAAKQPGPGDAASGQPIAMPPGMPPAQGLQRRIVALMRPMSLAVRRPSLLQSPKQSDCWAETRTPARRTESATRTAATCHFKLRTMVPPSVNSQGWVYCTVIEPLAPMALKSLNCESESPARTNVKGVVPRGAAG